MLRNTGDQFIIVPEKNLLHRDNQFYKNNTTFIITSDHDRGRKRNTWKTHILFIKGSGETGLGRLGAQGAPQSLADKMQDAWVQFAKTGSPGRDAYTTGERKTMLFNTTWQLQTNPSVKILNAWDGVREK